MTSPDSGDTPKNSGFPVTVDSKPFEAMSADERDDAERRAVAEILDTVSPEGRDEIRRILDDDPWRRGEIVTATSSPKLSRLFGVLQSIRRARSLMQPPEGYDASRPNDILVTVSMVSRLDPPDIRAAVVRSETDLGRPVVLLRATDITVADLERALRAAVITFKRYGKIDRTFEINRGNPAAPARLDWAQRILEQLLSPPPASNDPAAPHIDVIVPLNDV